jgi:hypothetical protein
MLRFRDINQLMVGMVACMSHVNHQMGFQKIEFGTTI